MKAIYVFAALALSACNSNERRDKTSNVSDSAAHRIDTADKIKEGKLSLPVKTYSNARFRDVTVKKTGEHTYTIQGKAQIFEANFSWVVEDGHHELQKGFQMTDAGAPEWGAFKFSIDVQMQRPNSTLTLILFESSAMDGSRQYELPIVLEAEAP